MIVRVDISDAAAKDLKTAPERVKSKLLVWVRMVEVSGLENVRKIPGFHDEPLKGKHAGQRSIRLSRAYRAIYVIRDDGSAAFVSIEEVSKHDY